MINIAWGITGAADKLEATFDEMEKVAGYEGVMPTYQGRLKDDEIGAIIEYIKTLGAVEGAP